MTATQQEAADLRAMADDVLGSAGTDVWDVVVDLGWPLVGIDEDAGGAGGSLDDLVTLVRAVGHHARPVPLVARSVGAWVAALSGAASPSGQVVAAGLDPTARVELHDDAPVVSGTLRRVPDSRGAVRLLAHVGSRRDRLVAVDLDGPGVSRTSGQNVAGEDRDDLVLDRAPVLAIAEPATSPTPTWEQVRTRTGLLRLAATVGAIDRVAALTTRYVQQREQFGRPLARFQLVQAGLATIAVEQAMASTILASATRRAGSSAANSIVAAAAIVVDRAAATVARTGHQLHGAMGTTQEYPLHAATTRLWAWADDGVTSGQAARDLGGGLLDSGAGVWAHVTGTTDPS